MKYSGILKTGTMRVALLTGIIILVAAGKSQAQSSQNGWISDIFVGKQRSQPELEKDALGWELPPGSKGEQGEKADKNDNSSVASQQTDQADAAEGWKAPAQGSESGYGSCKYATPEQEDFLCKMVRILYGPDTPRGPNRDMDENISAGGAGG